VVEAIGLWLKSLDDVIVLTSAPAFPEEAANVLVPNWVRECALRLQGTLFAPVSTALPEAEFTPYRAGYAIGLIKWGAARLKEGPPEILANGLQRLKLSTKAKRKIGRLLEDFYIREGIITRNEYRRSQFIPHDGRRYSRRIDRLPVAEAAEYYRGLSDGMGGIGSGAPGDKSNDASVIYWILATWWRIVVRLKNVTQLA
jgi:hypothetical protein